MKAKELLVSAGSLLLAGLILVVRPSGRPYWSCWTSTCLLQRSSRR